MHIRLNEILSSTCWSISYIVLTPVIVCIFVVWNASQRIDEFEQSHFHIAKATTAIVANEISKRIKNQNRLLRIFAKNHSELIYRIAKSPDDENLKTQLDKKVAESFPNYFSVSLANRDGFPIIDDFDGYVGELCMDDLKGHAKGKQQPMRIHPNQLAYHVDIVVPWDYSNGNLNNDHNGGLLFVSFIPDFLYEVLALSSTPKHQLMLVSNKVKNLIEITELGTRLQLNRDDYRLTQQEIKRKLYSTAVAGTVWNLTDFRDENLFSDYRKNIINYSITVFLLFIIASFIMLFILYRIERRRLKAEAIKEEMFSLFNHDLRSPLNSIFGFLEMYTESDICEKNPEQCKSLASKAFANAMIMREIVDDILDVQKMEAGEMSCHFKEIDLVSLVQDTIELNKQYSMMNKVKLKFEGDNKLINIQADARRIKQALTNLLSNAIKYSPENETVTISINIDNDKVIISVADNGPGIDKDFQSQVFNKFSQSKSKLTRRVVGTGLGLAIVKHIIELHGGSVTFVSVENEGATFKIFLPY